MRSVFSRIESVIRREPPGQMGLTPEYDHVRIPTINRGHRAPDPVRQGDVPSRPSLWDFTFFWHDQNKTQEESFTTGHIPRTPQVALMAGRQTADPTRANIRVPQHVAYGSLFTSSPTPYGYS